MIKGVFNLLKPAPHLPEMTDPEQIKETYQYWRVRIFYSMYVGYLFYYFTRKIFSSLTPFLVNDLGLTKSDIGTLASIWAITYAISKFTSAILADRSNPRYFMAIGLILTGLFNVLFGFSSTIVLFGIFWGLNGWFQGWGWPACTKQLTHWFSHSERGRWWSICCTSHTAGAVIISVLGPLVAQWFGWRWGMVIPSIFCFAIGLWLFNRLRDVPQSLGLPPIEKFHNEAIQEQKEDTLILPIKDILFKHVLNNKYVWILAISYFLVYIIREAVGNWGFLYLAQVKGYTPVASGICVALFDVGGFVGVLLAGWGSDKWFDRKRVPLIVLSSFALVFVVGGLWYLEPQQIILTSVWVTLLGFLVFIPQMLVGLAAAECVTKNAAGTANGFAGLCAYLGAVVAGYPLGRIIEVWGWYGFIVSLAICAALCVLVVLPIWSLKAGAHPTTADAEPPAVPQAVPLQTPTQTEAAA